MFVIRSSPQSAKIAELVANVERGKRAELAAMSSRSRATRTSTATTATPSRPVVDVRAVETMLPRLDFHATVRAHARAYLTQQPVKSGDVVKLLAGGQLWITNDGFEVRTIDGRRSRVCDR